MTNLTLGKTWLRQMNEGALRNNLTIQYCMSLSRHVLSSLALSAVTQIRVTNDYATNWDYGGEQWRLGVSSLFASSIGLAPFKDVFWTTSRQPGNPYAFTTYSRFIYEPYVQLNAVVSTMTGIQLFVLFNCI